MLGSTQEVENTPSQRAQPAIGFDGKPTPGLFGFDWLERDPKYEEKIKDYLVQELIEELYPSTP